VTMNPAAMFRRAAGCEAQAYRQPHWHVSHIRFILPRVGPPSTVGKRRAGLTYGPFGLPSPGTVNPIRDPAHKNAPDSRAETQPAQRAQFCYRF